MFKKIYYKVILNLVDKISLFFVFIYFVFKKIGFFLKSFFLFLIIFSFFLKNIIKGLFYYILIIFYLKLKNFYFINKLEKICYSFKFSYLASIFFFISKIMILVLPLLLLNLFCIIKYYINYSFIILYSCIRFALKIIYFAYLWFCIFIKFISLPICKDLVWYYKKYALFYVNYLCFVLKSIKFYLIKFCHYIASCITWNTGAPDFRTQLSWWKEEWITPFYPSFFIYLGICFLTRTGWFKLIVFYERSLYRLIWLYYFCKYFEKKAYLRRKKRQLFYFIEKIDKFIFIFLFSKFEKNFFFNWVISILPIYKYTLLYSLFNYLKKKLLNIFILIKKITLFIHIFFVTFLFNLTFYNKLLFFFLVLTFLTFFKILLFSLFFKKSKIQITTSLVYSIYNKLLPYSYKKIISTRWFRFFYKIYFTRKRLLKKFFVKFIFRILYKKRVLKLKNLKFKYRFWYFKPYSFRFRRILLFYLYNVRIKKQRKKKVFYHIYRRKFYRYVVVYGTKRYKKRIRIRGGKIPKLKKIWRNSSVNLSKKFVFYDMIKGIRWRSKGRTVYVYGKKSIRGLNAIRHFFRAILENIWYKICLPAINLKKYFFWFWKSAVYTKFKGKNSDSSNKNDNTK